MRAGNYIMNSDLTFITNEKDQNLKNRFETLIKDSRFFDCLVGYFYASGFYNVYKSLEKTKKIRILIGINTNRETYNLIQEGSHPIQNELQFSHAETKQALETEITKELEDS